MTRALARWWLMESANAEAGREAIAAFVALGPGHAAYGSTESRLPFGRILASGGRP